MDMKKRNVTSLILSVCLSFSSLASDVCQLQASSAVNVVRIQSLPGYFFKVHPNGKHIAYIGHGTNILLNLETGEESKLPGSIDPVWSPDGKLLSVPIYTESNNKNGDSKSDEDSSGSIHFYNSESLMKSAKENDIAGQKGLVSGLGGVYQSIGMVDGNYRVISDADGVSMVNLKIDKSIVELTPVGPPCGEMTIPTDIPMISKDGRFLSVYSAEEKSTKIFRFTESGCDLALDLGFPTGKVSFNNDSSQIAFHVDQFAEFEDGYFSGISKDKVKNVVVMNLAEDDNHRLTPTSWALASQHVKPGDGGYYPDFDAEGNIYFMEDIDNYFQFVKTNNSLLEFRNYVPGIFKLDGPCTTNAETSPGTSLNSLAKLWEQVCKDKTGISLQNDPSLVLAIEPASCEKLVADFWTEGLGVPKEEMLALCSKQNVSNPTIVGKWDQGKVRKAEEILQSKCMACHSKPLEYTKEEEIETINGAGEMGEMKIKSKRVLPAFELGKIDPQLIGMFYQSLADGAEYPMPKVGSIDNDEKEIVFEYLRRKYLDYSSKVVEASYQMNAVLLYSDEDLKKEIEKVFSTLPPQPETIKIKITVQLSCAYARKDCPEYHANELATSQELAASLPQAQRERFIHDRMMELKCSNYFDVSIYECQRWKMQQAELEN